MRYFLSLFVALLFCFGCNKTPPPLAHSYPDDMFAKIFSLTKKPIAITESSYIAEPWTFTVGSGEVTFSGSPEKQTPQKINYFFS